MPESTSDWKRVFVSGLRPAEPAIGRLGDKRQKVSLFQPNRCRGGAVNSM